MSNQSIDAVTWGALVKLISEHKYFFLKVFFGSFIFGLFLFGSFQNTYLSETTISLKKSSTSSDSLTSRIQDFAPLIGMSNNNLNAKYSAFYLSEKIKSRDFFRLLFNNDYDVANLIYYEGKNLFYDYKGVKMNVFDSNDGSWKTNLFGKSYEPGFMQAYEKYLSSITVTNDAKSGLLKIGFEHKSAEFSQKKLMMIISLLDEELRKKDILEISQSLEYLEEAYQQTQVSDLKYSISMLILQKYNDLALAKSNGLYLLDPIDLPSLPEEKFSPSRLVLLAMLIIASLLASLIFRISTKI